jgi:hypothetical protein
MSLDQSRDKGILIVGDMQEVAIDGSMQEVAHLLLVQGANYIPDISFFLEAIMDFFRITGA